MDRDQQAEHENIAYYVHDYFEKTYIGARRPNGSRKPGRFPIALWNVHQSTLNGHPRTNNICEGWHNAHASMTGASRPTVFRFLDSLKKDESITRAKIIDCSAGKLPLKQKRKDADRDAAVKNAVSIYVDRMAAEAKKAEEKAEAEEEDDEMNGEAGADNSDKMIEGEPEASQAGGNQWSRESTQREQWLETPTMELLSAFAHNDRL